MFNKDLMGCFLDSFNMEIEKVTSSSKSIAKTEGHIERFIEKWGNTSVENGVLFNELSDRITELITDKQESAYIKGIEDGIQLIMFFSKGSSVSNFLELMGDKADACEIGLIRDGINIR